MTKVRCDHWESCSATDDVDNPHCRPVPEVEVDA